LFQKTRELGFGIWRKIGTGLPLLQASLPHPLWRRALPVHLQGAEY
jgi:hypothetical protein